MADPNRPARLTRAARTLDRREFMRVSGLLASALALPGCVEKLALRRASDTAPHVPTDAAADDATTAPDGLEVTPEAGPDAGETASLPTLGGAPDTHEGRVIAAFIDTVVPGRHRDPDGRAGGIDVGAPGMFFDPELPAAPFVPVLVLLLDTTAEADFGARTFDQLLPSERDQVLTRALATVPVLEFAVQLAKLAHYASPVAGAELGYPGPNPGYVHDANFTFDDAITSELTVDGNYP